jgi:hypothetical protein
MLTYPALSAPPRSFATPFEGRVLARALPRLAVVEAHEAVR